MRVFLNLVIVVVAVCLVADLALLVRNVATQDHEDLGTAAGNLALGLISLVAWRARIGSGAAAADPEDPHEHPEHREHHQLGPHQVAGSPEPPSGSH